MRVRKKSKNMKNCGLKSDLIRSITKSWDDCDEKYMRGQRKNKNYEELWIKIRDLIRSLTTNWDGYDENYISKQRKNWKYKELWIKIKDLVRSITSK